MLDEFEHHLRQQNLSNNTVSAYLLSIRMYEQFAGDFTKQNLLAFKGYLMETYKPKTVNLRIQAINKYLEFIRKEKLRLWMGDSSERLVGRVYTHFEDDFMYEQMQTVKFDI